MRYPYINSRPKRALEIPDMVGGINLRDGISNIADNQLTDGLNVYDKDGRLRTRSGYKILDNIPKNVKRIYTQGERTLYYIGHNVIGEYRDNIIVCVSRASDDEYAPVTRDYIYLVGDAVSARDSISTAFESEILLGSFYTLKDNNLFCYFRKSYNGVETVSAYSLDLSDKQAEFTTEDIYIPLAYINYKPVGAGYDFEAVQFEGHSILTDKIKVVGSTVNPAESTHNARFRLPHPVKFGTTVTVKTISKNTSGSGTTENSHTISVIATNYDSEHNGYFEVTTSAYKIKVSKERNLISFFNTAGAGGYNTPMTYSDEDYIGNNLEIIYEPEISGGSSGLREAVFDSNAQFWYGGTANGITSGSRLFLGGATDPKYRNLIFWSGLNDATALLENCYAAVGDKSTGVTGFCQQGENLIIFKENSTHYTVTQYNNGITYEQLINQQIVDYSANAVYYPIIDISGDIGCDLPDTVKLCNNRLIWANKNGKVYTLTNANQFSQMNIYELSAMIERETSAKTIVGGNAVRYDGYYMLQYMINDNSQTVPDSVAYLLRLDSDGVRYITYGKVKNKEVKTAWFKFSLDGNMLNIDDAYGNIPALYMTEGSGHLFFYGFSQNDYDEIPDESGQVLTTEQREIDCFLLTKAFDFGLPNYRKYISDINITAGNNGGVPIGVTFKTDEGEEEIEIVPGGAETEDRSVSYYESYHFMPSHKGYSRMSLNLSSNGIIDIDKINLIYRILGGVK